MKPSAKSSSAPRAAWLLIALGPFGAAAPAQDALSAEEKTAPFAAIRWKGDAPEIEIDGAWRALLKIDGAPAERIVAFCKTTYGDGLWQKRFEEDLVEVLEKLGRAPPARSVLEVRDLATGTIETRRDVAWTKENRRLVWAASQARNGDFRPSPPPPVVVEAAAFITDLDALRAELLDGFSYLTRNGVDLDAVFSAAKRDLSGEIPRPVAVRRLTALLAAFGDGHTRVEENPDEVFGAGFAPFLVASVAGGRRAAFLPDRSAFLHPDAPYLVTIDGVPLERWIAAADAYAVKGSPQLRARSAERLLRHLAFFRSELKLPASSQVTIAVSDGRGGASRDVTLPLATKRPAFGDWPPTSAPRRLAPDVGYLRIAEMSDDAPDLDRVRATLKSFADARTLIVDLRGNGGGSRALIDVLVPAFMDPKAPPRVVNVARLKLRKGEGAEAGAALVNRGLHAADAPRWSEAERTVIVAAARGFKPEWTTPGDRWSALHFRTASPADASAAPRFAGEVAVLCDAGAFSATDILLGALKGLPRVTLVGTPSGGGSGRARGFSLPRTKIRVQYSTMASYRPDGRLYEGRGVEPDVLVEPAPEDLIGKTDSVLDAAVKKLR